VDSEPEQEYATFQLRVRGRIAQGMVELAVQKSPPSGLVGGGHNLVRWVVYPVLAQLDKWITSSNRAFLPGISGELYVLHMAMLPLQRCCTLSSQPGEANGPPIALQQFPGVPNDNKPLIPQLCVAIISMARMIYKKHMTSQNIVRHLLTLFSRIVSLCLKDTLNIAPMGKKFLVEVVEMTSFL
jgi:hypothetical protein